MIQSVFCILIWFEFLQPFKDISIISIWLLIKVGQKRKKKKKEKQSAKEKLPADLPQVEYGFPPCPRARLKVHNSYIPIDYSALIIRPWQSIKKLSCAQTKIVYK